MRTFIVIACLVAYAAAECNLLNKLKVKAQWEKAFGTEEQRTALATSVFRYLASKSPESQSLFTRVHGDDDHSPQFTAHMHRVMSGLDESISLLSEDEPLKAQLDHLAHQHDAMQIPTQYFHVFNEGLLLAVHAVLGRCFDETAWESCLHIIEDGIVGHRGD